MDSVRVSGANPVERYTQRKKERGRDRERLNWLSSGTNERVEAREKAVDPSLFPLIEPTRYGGRPVHETAKALEEISRSSSEQSIGEEKRAGTPLVDKQPWTYPLVEG